MNENTDLLRRDGPAALRNHVPSPLYAYLTAFAPVGVWLPPAVAGLLVLAGLPLAGIGRLFRAESISGFAGFLFFFAFLAVAFWLWSGSFGKLKRALALYWRVGRKIPVEHATTFAHLLSVWEEVCERIGWSERQQHIEMKDGKEVRRSEWVAPKVAGVDTNGPDLVVTAALPIGSAPSSFEGAAEAWRAALGVYNVTISDAGGMSPAVLLCISYGDRLAGLVEVSKDRSPIPLGPVEVARLEDGSRLAWDLRESTHTAVQGMVRSGKSVACYTLLSQVARMPEDDVEVWGIDPASVLLGPWRKRLHGSERIVLGTDGQEALHLMNAMVAEMDSRLGRLERDGREKFQPGQDDGPPVMLVVLEEWPGLLRAVEAQDAQVKTPDRVANRLRAGMERLVSEGPKVSVRVLLVVQRADASIVGGYARGQFGMRLTFAVDNAEAVAMLHPATPRDKAGEVMGFPPGRALVWHNRREQVGQFDLCEYSTYRQLVLNGGEPPMYVSEDEPIIT